MIRSGRYEIGLVEDIPEGGCAKALVGGELVAVFNVDGVLYALSDVCSHGQASLSEGRLSGYSVTCPLHGARFDVRTGEALGLPATAPVATFLVEVEDGRILVTIP